MLGQPEVTSSRGLFVYWVLFCFVSVVGGVILNGEGTDANTQDFLANKGDLVTSSVP